jgi:hypothetical protein
MVRRSSLSNHLTSVLRLLQSMQDRAIYRIHIAMENWQKDIRAFQVVFNKNKRTIT